MAYQRTVVSEILIAQALVSVVFASCLTLLGKQEAMSALIGGLICLIPNVYLARKLMTSASKRTADSSILINTLYAAEFGKILITIVLFAVVFVTQEWIHPVALLAGFGIAQLTHWLTPLVMSVINNNRD